MRKTHRSGNVALPKEFGTAYIEQHEPGFTPFQRFVNVPAVRFKSEQGFKVRKRRRGIRGRDFGDRRAVHGIRHLTLLLATACIEAMHDCERQE
jgi:hypothetical protein